MEEFQKKFKSISGNAWDDQDNFESITEKNSIVEMGLEEKGASAMVSRKTNTSSPTSILPSTLDSTTISRAGLILDKDLF